MRFGDTAYDRASRAAKVAQTTKSAWRKANAAYLVRGAQNGSPTFGRTDDKTHAERRRDIRTAFGLANG